MQSGHSLLEALVVLALTGLALTSVGAARDLREATILVQATDDLKRLALRARGRAYLGGQTTELRFSVGSSRVELRTEGSQVTQVDLFRSVVVMAAPRSGRIRFFAGGLADNATVILGILNKDARSSMIVNQRGMIR